MFELLTSCSALWEFRNPLDIVSTDVMVKYCKKRNRIPRKKHSRFTAVAIRIDSHGMGVSEKWACLNVPFHSMIVSV